MAATSRFAFFSWQNALVLWIVGLPLLRGKLDCSSRHIPLLHIGQYAKTPDTGLQIPGISSPSSQRISCIYIFFSEPGKKL